MFAGHLPKIAVDMNFIDGDTLRASLGPDRWIEGFSGRDLMIGDLVLAIGEEGEACVAEVVGLSRPATLHLLMETWQTPEVAYDGETVYGKDKTGNYVKVGYAA